MALVFWEASELKNLALPDKMQIFSVFRSNMSQAAITIDLSKAFDYINHSLLIAKFPAYGITEDALKLLVSYIE